MGHGFLSSLGRQASEARDTAEDYGRYGRRRLRRGMYEARHAGRRLRERGEDTRGELRRLWSQLEDLVERRITPAASDAARAAGDYAREGRDMALDMADHLRDAARARPLVAIGIAVAATWIVASLLNARRHQ
ncbi:MAG: hypothetical protein IRY87_13050 [Acetobacteraceae bacterium]|nr:hypothetical protein [Acetobacteraceae bacterium]